MDWGIQKADKLGVYCYMEGSQTGVPLYRKHEFEIIEEKEIKPGKKEEEKSEEWKVLEQTLVETLTVMRRPFRG
jgi:hypothetical protein